MPGSRQQRFTAQISRTTAASFATCPAAEVGVPAGQRRRRRAASWTAAPGALRPGLDPLPGCRLECPKPAARRLRQTQPDDLLEALQRLAEPEDQLTPAHVPDRRRRSQSIPSRPFSRILATSASQRITGTPPSAARFTHTWKSVSVALGTRNQVPL